MTLTSLRRRAPLAAGGALIVGLTLSGCAHQTALDEPARLPGGRTGMTATEHCLRYNMARAVDWQVIEAECAAGTPDPAPADEDAPEN